MASEGVFVEKTVISPEVPESTMKARKLYILPKEFAGMQEMSVVCEGQQFVVYSSALRGMQAADHARAR